MIKYNLTYYKYTDIHNYYEIITFIKYVYNRNNISN